jgi:hypothetical protein
VRKATSSGDTAGLAAESLEGESIAQRSQRTQRGDRKGETFTGDTAGLAARITRRGKHRTEVTEDTEGDRKGETFYRGHRWPGCENHAKRKASHRGHRGHRGGSGVGGTKLLPGTVGLDARITRKEEGIARRHGDNELKSNSVTDVLTHKC